LRILGKKLTANMGSDQRSLRILPAHGRAGLEIVRMLCGL